MTRTPAYGFTLLEMAVTLIIVSFLLGGLIMTLGAQQDVNRDRESRRLLIQAREALYGYAMQHGRLPCPANGALASGIAGAGEERDPTPTGCTGGAAGLSGVLPWATLGLPEVDAWGRRFSYRVTAEFARTVSDTRPAEQFGCTPAPDPAPTQSAFALCTPGGLTVRNLASAGGQVQASALPAVIVSHGANGLGGFMPSGSVVPGAAGDESENADADVDFVAGTRTDNFDDLVEWVVPSILMHRMVQAGRLP